MKNESHVVISALWHEVSREVETASGGISRHPKLRLLCLLNVAGVSAMRKIGKESGVGRL